MAQGLSTRRHLHVQRRRRHNRGRIRQPPLVSAYRAVPASGLNDDRNRFPKEGPATLAGNLSLPTEHDVFVWVGESWGEYIAVLLPWSSAPRQHGSISDVALPFQILHDAQDAP